MASHLYVTPRRMEYQSANQELCIIQFINLASGSDLPVRNSLGSCTTELESSTFSLDGQTVTLIDTPGFDDTTPSVLNVLKSISDYYAQL